MRKVIVISMITLDGVMQAPSGPEEDKSSSFEYGGWTGPYSDEVIDEVIAKEMERRTDYLLGRKTFEIFASYWPEHADSWPSINEGTKYVVSNTIEQSDWKNTLFLKSLTDIERVKRETGSDIQVWGSQRLIQLLLKHDLVDELWLKVVPVTLGQGIKLFAEGTIPAAFTLVGSTITPSGVISANYQRAGEVRTGTVGT